MPALSHQATKAQLQRRNGYAFLWGCKGFGCGRWNFPRKEFATQQELSDDESSSSESTSSGSSSADKEHTQLLRDSLY